MTYDPRMTDNPYLGIDVDDDEFDEQESSSPASALPEETRLIDQVKPEASRNPAVPPATVRRPAAAPQRGVAPARPDVPMRRPVPSPPQEPHYQKQASPIRVPRQASGAFLSLGGFALRLLAVVFRAMAIALSVVVVASAVLTGSSRYFLVQAVNAVNTIIPPTLMGRFVVETPLGGALRGDLVIISVVLFLFDWLCLFYASSLCNMRREA